MKKENYKIKLYGTTTIGSKGQIVIPKEVRDKLNMKPGDSVIIITKNNLAVAIIKNENIKELFNYMKSEGINLPE